MKARSVITLVISAIVATLTVMILAMFITYRQQCAVIESRKHVVQTYQTLSMLDDLSDTVREAEINERGYLITGSAADLERYKSSASRITGSLQQFKPRFAGSPMDVYRFERLEDALRSLISECDRIAQLRETEGQTVTRATIQTHQHLQKLKAFRQTVDDITNEEKSTLETQSNQLARDVNLNWLMLLSLAAMCIVIVIMGGLQLCALVTQQQAANKLAAFVSAVSRELTFDHSLDEMLRRITDLAVEHAHAAFARVWLFDSRDQVLKLTASSGIYTNLNGAHSRIPLGKFKIGLIAQTQKPLLTNDLCNDPHISDPEWAKKNRMVSFAGYPLVLENQLVGVIGLFARHRLSRNTLIAAESIANSVSVAIRQKQEKEQLLQNEDLLRSLAENVNAAFVINHADQAGALYVNSSVEEIYGVSKEQILKNRFSFFRLVHKDDRQALRHFMLDATPEEQAAGLEFRVVHRDGSLHWIWGRLFPKIGSKDHVVYGISQDVTARKETEQRVKEFYSIISHELRTPLTSIHASFRLMESGLAGPLPPKAARVAEIGRKETDRLVRLVNNLLDVHKLEEGMLRVTLAPVKAQNLVELSLAAMKGMAQDAGVSINSIVDWNGTIMCDQDRMIQVLTNLLSNAIKHSASQGDITLKVATQGQSLRFEVIDHGPGIAKELLPLLFHKFLQVETSDARGKRGSGLGLVVAKAIVEQHGGKVGVDSDLGRGSTFWVELPMRSESKSQGQESSPASTELVGSM